MINIKDFLKCFLITLLLIALYNYYTCKENLTLENKFCNPTLFNTDTLLGISTFDDKKLSKDDTTVNLTTKTTSDTSWIFQRIITKKNIGDTVDDMEKCSLYIKTIIEKDNDKINYFLTRTKIRNNFGELIDKISLDLFNNNDDENKQWFVVNINEIKTGLSTEISNLTDENIYFIMTSPKYFVNDSNDYPTTKFLEYDSSTTKSPYGTFKLVTSPSMKSVWKIDFINEGSKDSKFNPTKGVGVFPNKNNKEYSDFMPEFIPENTEYSIWNNKFFYSYNTSEKPKKITIKLDKPPYNVSDISGFSLNKTYTSGTVTLDENYEEPLKNKVFNVKTHSANKLYGYTEDKKLSIIVEMLNRDDEELRPRIKGWVKEEKEGITNIKPICGSVNTDLHAECISSPTNLEMAMMQTN